MREELRAAQARADKLRADVAAAEAAEEQRKAEKEEKRRRKVDAARPKVPAK